MSLIFRVNLRTCKATDMHGLPSNRDDTEKFHTRAQSSSIPLPTKNIRALTSSPGRRDCINSTPIMSQARIYGRRLGPSELTSTTRYHTTGELMMARLAD